MSLNSFLCSTDIYGVSGSRHVSISAMKKALASVCVGEGRWDDGGRKRRRIEGFLTGRYVER